LSVQSNIQPLKGTAMSLQTLSNFMLLPELKLLKMVRENRHNARWYCQKEPQMEFCPKCATASHSTYDHRTIRIKDAPVRGNGVILLIRKRRLWCRPCRKPFSEPVPGIRKGKRHTERFVASLHWACENFADLKQVRRAYQCSAYFLYQVYYEQLERKRLEKINYPWPKIIGIDEHSFKRNPQTGRTEFASMIVDFVHPRVREITYGKSQAELEQQLAHIPERENVMCAVIDMCDPFKNFIRSFFPHALIVADKFHVLRLLSPALLRKRKEISGTRADLKAKKLLLMSSHKLDYFSRLAIDQFLQKYPEMHELYRWKERLHSFYRIRGFTRAKEALTQLTDEMASSQIQEIKTLRRTLLKWRVEILNYFKTGITNARTEGFNNKAKVVKRRAYGYKSFRNYRLKVLTACA
jgi:transposase